MLAVVLSTLALATTHSEPIDPRLAPYVEALREKVQKPTELILDALERHDLILLDDAVHTAVEPFEFYQQLVRLPGLQEQAPAIFVEVLTVDQQDNLDRYLTSEPEDLSLLNL